MKWTYGFVPWPEHCDLSQAMQKLLRLIKHRHEEVFTEAEFREFRLGLEVDGVQLCEIERVPYCDPETVV